MKRDFSNASRQKILNLVADVEREKFSNFTDWIGDSYFTFQSWIGRLNIRNYINNVDAYHRKVIDKNNASKKTINQIFNDVASVDSTYQRRLSSVKSSLQKWDKYIMQMNQIVSPGSSFTMQYVTDSLDGILKQYVTDEISTLSSSLLDLLLKGLLGSGYGENDTVTEIIKTDKEILDAAAGITENIGKYGKIESVALSSSILSYLSALCGVATSDINSGRDIFSQMVTLFKESVGVEKGIYKYFEKTLSPYEFSKLDGKFGKAMTGLSLLSSLVGTVDTGIDTYEVFADGDSTASEKIAQTIDMGGAVFDLGGKTYIASQASTKALQFVNSAGKSSKVVNQILSTEQTLKYTTTSSVSKNISRAGTAVALVNVATSTASGVVRRWGEVNADGKIDTQDVSSVSVHAALGGLQTVTSTLTCGFINFDGEQVADELETEVSDFVRSDDWKARYIRDQNKDVVTRFLVSTWSGAEMIGEKVIDGVGECVNTVGNWISTGWNSITSWMK